MQKLSKILLIVRATNTVGETSSGYDTTYIGMTPLRNSVHKYLLSPRRLRRAKDRSWGEDRWGRIMERLIAQEREGSEVSAMKPHSTAPYPQKKQKYFTFSLF